LRLPGICGGLASCGGPHIHRPSSPSLAPALLRARALAFAARPFQGRSLGVSPFAKMCAFSQGLRPGLSCATLSGSSASSIRISPWQASETSDKRHRSWVAAGCRPSAPHQGFIEQPMAATRQSDDPWKRHNRYRNRYRDRFRRHCAADINTEASDHALFSIAIATATPVPMPTPFFHGAEKSFPFWEGFSG
ncbi:MAG: hypothetical protein H6Q05_3462, partial [Acidobacteria bacterium]|nr:hypothetical protein [Acidobacteriota bacterium]